MSDDYICSVCGHRAGDHAAYNRCIVDKCMCVDDPYLAQLDALQAKLDIAVGDIKEVIAFLDSEDLCYINEIHERLTTVLNKLEEK